MELSNLQFGLTLMVVGMGLTMITLYLLTWVSRLLTKCFQEKEQE